MNLWLLFKEGIPTRASAFFFFFSSERLSSSEKRNLDHYCMLLAACLRHSGPQHRKFYQQICPRLDWRALGGPVSARPAHPPAKDSKQRVSGRHVTCFYTRS